MDASDWIAAGIKRLSNDGIEAVRIEPLAVELGVTKGSFYWHFKDRRALLDAMLDHWQRIATNAVIDEAKQRAKSPKGRLKALFQIVLQSDGRLDMAIRAWALTDPTAAQALRAIDRRRLGYVEDLFLEIGLRPSDARARARFSYDALLGQYARGRANPGLGPAGEFDAIFRMLTRKPS